MDIIGDINNNNNNNQNKNIKELSNSTIRLIISHLQSPIDSFCFALTCKKWFKEREKFLSKPDHLTPVRYSKKIKHINLTLDMIEKDDFSISEQITSIQFQWAFSRPLPSHFFIPDHITKVDLAGLINQEIKIGFLPQNIQYLDMSGVRFKSSMEEQLIPSRVEHLILPYQYNIQLKPRVIPDSVKTLVFGFFYNHPLQDGIIPNGVTDLEFGNDFNHPLEYLPSNLTKLKLGASFNQSISKESLPETLTDLTFGFHFNQVLEPNCIPKNITSLCFGCNFNQPIVPSGIIPKQVSKLEFGFNFNHPIPRDSIPKSVQTLIFGNCFNQRLYYKSIPNQVEYLSIGQNFSYKLFISPIIIGNHRLFNIETNSITTTTTTTNQMNLLPKSIKELSFGTSFLNQNKFFNIPHSISSFNLLVQQPLKIRRYNSRSIILLHEKSMRGCFIDNNKFNEQFTLILNKMHNYPKFSFINY